jgi:hypothetical protein
MVFECAQFLKFPDDRSGHGAYYSGGGNNFQMCDLDLPGSKAGCIFQWNTVEKKNTMCYGPNHF